MKRLLAMLAFVAMGLVSAAAFALPSVTDVQAEVQKGNYAQAETLMRDVVAAKPGSAKAHYVYAEILAHNKRFEFALQETRLAKQLDPAIGFTQPEKFKSFEQLLEREQRGATAGGNATGGNTAGTAMQAPRAVEQRSSGIPGWIWGAGFAVIAVLLWRMFSARRAQPMTPAYAGGMPTGGYGPNYSPMGGGTGSGMLGTGLAAAGGFAAGMLAEKMLDGHRDGGSSSASHASDGGLTPGYFDNGAADELSNRSVDFGSGGDWDSGGGGGGSDGGGSDGW
ncbi:tetratricopeptide repeat protein [Rhizobacter sp. P5_C2]